MDKIRCFNCQKSIFYDNKGNVHHHRICAYRKIHITGDQIFKSRSCRYFDLRHERLQHVRVAEKKQEKVNV